MAGDGVKFGVNLNNREPLIAPDYGLSDLLALAERAEALGFDSVWVGDSLFSKPRWEPINLLSAFSQRPLDRRDDLGPGRAAEYGRLVVAADSSGRQALRQPGVASGLAAGVRQPLDGLHGHA